MPFFVSREFYLRNDKSKIAEILGTNRCKLALSCIKFSFIFVELQESDFQISA